MLHLHIARFSRDFVTIWICVKLYGMKSLNMMRNAASSQLHSSELEIKNGNLMLKI